MPHLNVVFDPGFETNFSLPSKTIQLSSIIQRPVSGRGEIRASLQPYPLWKIKYECTFARGSEQDAGVYQYLAGFFIAMGGRFSDFLYEDPGDNHADNALLGIGDGATTTFQLLNSVGIGMNIIQNLNPDSTPIVFVNGAAISASAYTISYNGILQFTTAPVAGSVITWTGDFYYRVRFGDDETTFDQEFSNIWNNGDVTLQSVIL